MKYPFPFFLAVFLLLTLPARTQSRMENPAGQNFYVGMANPLLVTGGDVTSLTVESSAGTCSRAGGKRYFLQFQSPGETTLTLSTEVDGKKVVLESRTFQVKRIPEPTVAIDGNSQLILQYPPDYPSMYRKKVAGFTVELTRGDKTETLQIQGDVISPDLISPLAVSSYDQAVIREIRVAETNGVVLQDVIDLKKGR